MATPAMPTTATAAPAQNAVPKRAGRSGPDDDEPPRCFFGFSAISPVIGAASSSRSACADVPFSDAPESPPDATTCGAADVSMRTMFGSAAEPNDLTTLPLSSLPST